MAVARKESTVVRNTLFAIVMAVGMAALTQAQPPSRSFPPPDQQISLAGTWYYKGDPDQPCYIQPAPDIGPGGFVLTNEFGDQSRGRVLPGGLVVARDWDDLRGRVERGGERIRWANGTYWSR
jgi:hypothetical protein